jgi:hypothetical protein
MMTYTPDAAIPQELEDAIWTDAYRIAWIGAANPVAVAGSLAKHSAALLHIVGTAGVEAHPGLKAITGHLAYLYHHGLGPEMDELDEVQAQAYRLGLLSDSDRAQYERRMASM